MKIKPQIYAKMIAENIDDGNIKQLASSILQTLHKNKQERSLPIILELAEKEYAKRNNRIIAKIYAEKALDDGAKRDICDKLQNKYGKKVELKEIKKSNIAGFEVTVDDKIIDLSTLGKLELIKRRINS